MFSREISAIGIIHSPFKEKFAVPRQPKLIERVHSAIEFYPPYDDLNSFREIELFSHLWIIFVFNLIGDNSFRPLVRPPRLGGNRKVGVFASRSPFRPNNLGLSCVRNLGVKRENGHTYLNVAGADLVDGTPIIDVKPYIKFTDSIENANSSYASDIPNTYEVRFSDQSEHFINGLDSLKYPNFRELVKEIVSYDPRPAYKANSAEREKNQTYGFDFCDFNVMFQVFTDYILVTEIVVK